MYDPTTARFLTKDPIGKKGGSPNFYLYCYNDPINKIDPSGGEYFIAGKTRARQFAAKLEEDPLKLQEYTDFRLEDVTTLPGGIRWSDNKGKPIISALSDRVYYVAIGPRGVAAIKAIEKSHPELYKSLSPLLYWDNLSIETPSGAVKKLKLIGLGEGKPAADEILFQLDEGQSRDKHLLLRYNYELGFDKASLQPFEQVLMLPNAAPPGKNLEKATKGRKSIRDILDEGKIDSIPTAYDRFVEAGKEYPAYSSPTPSFQLFADRYLIGPAKAKIQRELKRLGIDIEFDDGIIDALYEALVNENYNPLATIAADQLINNLFPDERRRSLFKKLFRTILTDKLSNKGELIRLVVESIDPDAAAIIEALLDEDSLAPDQIKAVIRFAKRYIDPKDTKTIESIEKLLSNERDGTAVNQLICLLKEATTDPKHKEILSLLGDVYKNRDAILKGDPKALSALLESVSDLIPDSSSELLVEAKRLLKKLSTNLPQLLDMLEAGIAIWQVLDSLRSILKKAKNKGDLLDPALRKDLEKLADNLDKASTHKLGGDPKAKVKPGTPIRIILGILAAAGLAAFWGIAGGLRAIPLLEEGANAAYFELTNLDGGVAAKNGRAAKNDEVLDKIQVPSGFAGAYYPGGVGQRPVFLAYPSTTTNPNNDELAINSSAKLKDGGPLRVVPDRRGHEVVATALISRVKGATQDNVWAFTILLLAENKLDIAWSSRSVKGAPIDFGTPVTVWYSLFHL